MQMKSLKEQKSEITKGKLLEATDKILKTYGCDYLTVRNICEMAEVSSGSFYHHFETKENLVYLYLSDLYKQAVADNPIPLSVKEEAYMGEVIWPFLVYLKFCEAIGVELTKILFANQMKDLFYEYSFPQIRNKVIEIFTNEKKRYNDGISEDIFYDLQAMYKGVLASWCFFSFASAQRSICEDLEHLIFRFFLSFENDDVVKNILAGHLISERPEFDAYFHMDCVKIVH